MTRIVPRSKDPRDTVNQDNPNQSYILVIVSLSSIKSYLWVEFSSMSRDLNIPSHEFEALYDWMITEAIDKVLALKKTRVLYHYRHDVYKCVYDRVGHFVEHAINKQITMHELKFLEKQTVKVMVAGDSLILARGILQND